MTKDRVPEPAIGLLGLWAWEKEYGALPDPVGSDGSLGKMVDELRIALGVHGIVVPVVNPSMTL
jgi:hypothetical protein